MSLERRSVGFTLIEMMIVVAVIAILARLALPAYMDSVRKARRTDARTALVTASQQLERYNTENGVNGYLNASAGPAASDTIRSTSENKYYNIALSNVAVKTYTVTATPTGGQATDACGSFTLNESGLRGVNGGNLTATDCW